MLGERSFSKSIFDVVVPINPLCTARVPLPPAVCPVETATVDFGSTTVLVVVLLHE